MELKKYDLLPIPRPIQAQSENDAIYLSIQIGNGQIGGNYVSKDNQLLAKGNLKDPTFIGYASVLKNSELEIETNVLDVNPSTNLCVITTTFNNQQNQVLFSSIDQALAPENGIASFKGKYMILSLTILLLFFGCLNINVNAQNSSEQVSFPDLETPSSPGLILLDQAPSAIEKSTTPQSFGLGILGLFQGTGGAMEFAPFWFFTHEHLTAKKMSDQKFPVLYNLSISVATFKEDSNSYFSGGFRTRVFQFFGESQKLKLDTLRQEIIDALSMRADDIDLNKIEELRKNYVGITEKPVFNIDIAAAVGGGSMSNSFNNLELNRWATWITFNFRPKGNDFYITALTRFIINEKFEEYTLNSNLMDIGTRLNYDISKLCLSLEYLQRLNFTDKKYDDYRIAVVGSYRISDTFYITSTFGKNFTETNNIIALAGVNVGFSKAKIKAYDSEDYK